MNQYGFLFFYVVILACNEIPDKHKADLVSDSVPVVPVQSAESLDVTERQSEASSVVDCDEALNQMFQTSNYHPDSTLQLSDYRIHVSEPGDSALGIRIYHTHDHDSALMGILNLDLRTGRLVDLSPYLDSAMELKYDSVWLGIIRKQCGNLPQAFY
ncbi:hypothetical protein SAMN05660909_02483 [Chitinophaga terrae (ex Kim and Jung 2007)]|uniref:Uncharacterized protein n=1 Tax=Chitinophaga terrae (ex Kim and Jung 2007) TaxID=408074 RepID=A0A1H4C671_9BACT|nr:hypothetical protein [Chitinophaga terrae (ex Kim and Jung 2007)]GEP92248.1 hypothetical protein CTE07_38930 [Chitinophaga terrae (ex Kim and Jung 2007)]SEA55820.1 hypothetical protein SAMN05660909_02483 [Chitinophaga terrae (ex Kim and Jung 2007)]